METIDAITQVEATAEQLYSAAEVNAALDRMGDEISQAMAQRNPLVLCVMVGGMIPAGQLLTRLSFPLTVDTIHATRYQGDTAGGEIEWRRTPDESVAGRTVLLIDDVLDEGITLEAICCWCRDQGAREVYSAVLVDKALGRGKPHQADFIGLTADNRYLFGYGMDYQGYLRNADGIFACRGS